MRGESPLTCDEVRTLASVTSVAKRQGRMTQREARRAAGERYRSAARIRSETEPTGMSNASGAVRAEKAGVSTRNS